MFKVAAFSVVVLSCSSPATRPPEVAEMPKKQVKPDAKPAATKSVDDPFLWLEDVKSEKALAWARERNKQSQAELEAEPMFAKTRDRIRAILDSKDKTPYVAKRGKHFYNFWQD